MFSIRSGDTCVLHIDLERSTQTLAESTQDERVFLSIGESNSPLLIKEVIGYEVKLEYEDTINIPDGIYDIEVRVMTNDLSMVETPIYDRIKILPTINHQLQQDVKGGVIDETTI